MKLSQDMIKKIKNELTSLGWKDEGNTRSFNYFLQKKHWSRYTELIKWMRGKELPLGENDVYTAYKIDITVRSKLARILKPIELEIIAHICYCFEENNIDITKLISGNLYEDTTKFKRLLQIRRNRTTKWLSEAFEKIINKKPDIIITDLINELTFGQVSGLLQLLKVEWIKKIFNDDTDKVEIIDILDNVVGLRNMIAHHNILLSNNVIEVKNRRVTLSSLITSLSMLTIGDYRTKLKNDLTKYCEFLSTQAEKEGSHSQVVPKLLYQAVISHVIGV